MAQKNEKINKKDEIKKVESVNKADENIDTSNIFSEFTDDSGLKNEVEKIIQEQNKDIFYYLEIIGNYIKSIFWLFLLMFLLVYLYIYVQEDEELTNSNILDPFCTIILGDIENKSTYCSSVTSLNNEYIADLKKIKNEQFDEINEIIEDLYKIENFSKTKEVLFLKEKSYLKLPALKIIEDFDNLKNEFEPIEKQKIKCYNIEINKEYVFKARCEAFSTEFDKEIKGFDGTDGVLVSGRSISYANSFLNFIEKKSENFSHISRQNVFTSVSVVGDNTGYTNKTTFYLELKYSSNNLSL